MRPSAPKTIVWILGIIFGLVGIIGHFVSIDFVTTYSYWFLLVGFALLAVGTTFKGV